MKSPGLIPQKNPRAGYLAHKDEIDAAVARVLNGGSYILGQEVAAFEKEFAEYLGGGFCLGVGSGTEALELCLRLCDVGPGDGVFTVSHTAVATVAAIELAGGTPIFVDIDPSTYTMEPQSLEDAVRAVLRLQPDHFIRAKAVIPVHLYGHPADMPGIMEIAARYSLAVIEDCAQSHGASLEERKTGTWGTVAAFSFYPTKNLGGVGDGGAVFTRDEDLAGRARELREYGWRTRNVSEQPGMNSRLDELQAAVLRVKLSHLERDTAVVRGRADTYDALLGGTKLVLPRARPGVVHVYHQYVVRSDRRDPLRDRLTRRGIRTAVHYPLPVHLQPAYRGRIPLVVPLPRTEKAAGEILSLPIYPELSEEAAGRVAEEIVLWDSGK